MANEILKGEQLTDEQLDRIAGGTQAETEELFNLIGIRNASQVEDWLKDNLDIDADISRGWHGGDSNIANRYFRYDEQLSHKQIVAEIKLFFRTK